MSTARSCKPPADKSRSRLSAGPASVSPFTGLSFPAGAVDAAGTVYVSDQDNKRALELAAR
jgi:hypothetical protein